MLNKIKSGFSLWNVVRGMTSSHLANQAALPVSLAIVGDNDDYEKVRERFGNSSNIGQVPPGSEIEHRDGQIVVDGARLARASEFEFEEALSKIALRHGDRRIALASSLPVFRNVVVNQLSHEKAFENARFAAISALPGVIPMTDWLLPATSAGDLFVLTKNQVTLLLEVAACYGRPVDVKARLKELLPVVGGAFGWRAVARELVGLVPGGIGVAVKSAIAYAGTYSVGRAAAYYYGGDSRLRGDLRLTTIYRDSARQIFERFRRHSA